jgi:hypothetical protein
MEDIEARRSNQGSATVISPVVKNANISRFGYYVSVITAILTVVSFGIAVCTPPLSGPFCQGDCFRYPYHDILSRFPRDYYWMYPAILLSFSYLVMMITVHRSMPAERNLFSAVASGFAIISSLILSSDYFIQVSFIQPSLLAGETDGVAMMSQFNPHGIFIILEELGFVVMGISFLFLVPAFGGPTRLEKSLRLTFIISFFLTVIAFIAISAVHGIMREYRFEVAVISITWIELIIVSILFSKYFRRKDN